MLVGIALVFEMLGWIFVGQSFLVNPQRLTIMILQVSVIGIIAVGVTQVIITGGIDLSSGSVVGLTAMVAASLAQTVDLAARRLSGADRPAGRSCPIARRPRRRLLAGIDQRRADRLHRDPALHRHARHDGHGPRPGQMVHAAASRCRVLTEPVQASIGSGIWPVVIFLVVALIFHIALRYTRYGKFTYAIGANRRRRASRASMSSAHLVKVYAIAGLLAGLAGVVTSARATSGQAGMGVMYELDAIAATVIGGTSLSGGVGRITGTVIGTIILGVMTSGFTFLRVDAYYQEIVKGLIIVAAVVVDQYRQKAQEGLIRLEASTVAREVRLAPPSRLRFAGLPGRNSQTTAQTVDHRGSRTAAGG